MAKKSEKNEYKNRNGGHDVSEAVFMLQGSMFTYPTQQNY